MNKKYVTLGIPAGLVGATLLIGVFLYDRPASRDFPKLQPMLEQFAAPGQEHADPAQCVECHREITEKWLQSHHSVANAPLTQADRELLRTQREGLLAERGIEFIEKSDTFILKEKDLPPYPAVGTIGITPLVQYLFLAPDGRIQTQDVAWDVGLKEWFSIFEGEEGPPRVQGEWGHWTGQGMNWDANCAYCHMTEYRKNFDPVSNSYDRTWTHMSITCAQCHPGMEAHLSQIRNGNKYFHEELSPVQYMETCATCHSRRDQLTPDDFAPGDLFEDHYHLTLADLDGIYHPDGQVIGENYVYGSLTMSKMGTAGVTCLDCHDPHSGGFILPVDNNALCMRCHGSGLKDAPKINPVQHSHHPAESSGNLCIECHMPSTNFMARDPRRDHSFSNPDPRLTLEMGIPNACSKCHTTQSVEWSRDYAEKWYGPEMNADRRAKARLLRDTWDGVEGVAPRLRAAILAEKNRFWKSTFVSMLQYTAVDQESYQLLLQLLDDPEAMVRSATVRLLGTSNIDPAKAAALYSDPFRSVRISAALTSPEMADLSPDQKAELRAYMEHTADTPIGSLRLADYVDKMGDKEQAKALARQAVTFDRMNPEAYRLAAIQLHASGDTQGALKMLKDALLVDPENPLVHFNLGLLLAETRDMDGAFRYLNKTVSLDPRMENAWYNLIVLYWQVDSMDTARDTLEKALTALPQSPRLNQLARQMPPPN